MTPFHAQTATALAAAIRAGKVSAGTVLEFHIARIEAHDSDLNCFTDRIFGRARAQAAAIDAQIAAGRDPRPPRRRAHRRQKPLRYRRPAHPRRLPDFPRRPARSSRRALLARLTAAGAVLLGALNMDEFAYGFVTGKRA